MSRAIEFESTPLKTVSKEQGVYDQLRRAIISGTLKPGQRLVPAEIADQLQVSTMPVRNTLMRLEAERLVTRAPHREYVVTHYSAKEIKELYSIRAVLDGYAGRMAAENMTASRLEELRAIVRRAERHLAEGDIDRVVASNREFHTTLYRQSGNEQLLQMIQMLRDRCDRYRGAYYAVPGVPVQTVEEHRNVLAALERGDHDAVEEVLRKDAQSTGSSLLLVIDSAGEANDA